MFDIATDDIYLEWIKQRTEKAETNIHTRTLYEDFVKWIKLVTDGLEVIVDCPTPWGFAKAIKRHLTFRKNIWVEKTNRQGVMNLKLKAFDAEIPKLILKATSKDHNVSNDTKPDVDIIERPSVVMQRSNM